MYKVFYLFTSFEKHFILSKINKPIWPSEIKVINKRLEYLLKNAYNERHKFFWTLYAVSKFLYILKFVHTNLSYVYKCSLIYNYLIIK